MVSDWNHRIEIRDAKTGKIIKDAIWEDQGNILDESTYVSKIIVKGKEYYSKVPATKSNCMTAIRYINDLYNFLQHGFVVETTY